MITSRIALALAAGAALGGCKSSPAARSSDAPPGGGDGGGSAIDAPPGDTTGPLARAANDFLDSLGACTHVGQGVDDPTMSATALAFAGIRGIRDDGVASHVGDWIAMHQAAGVRLSLLTDQDVSSTVGMAESLAAAGALLAVEGPNEPNNFPVTYNGATSSSTTFMPVAQLQRDLYAAVHADAALAGIPVFHSSEAGGSEPDDVGLQWLVIPTGANATMPDGTPYADYANTHNYVTGTQNTGLVDNNAWGAEDPVLNGAWDGMYVEYSHTWNKGFAGYATSDLPAVPRVTTETGWPTQGAGAITEEQQARLFLNLYLAAFARGWSYTFIYMLRDDPTQGYWGLFGTDYSAKTSGTYVHNLTAILADTPGGAAPGHLNYSIAGEPVTVHDLLLQKADRTFELAVWDERADGSADAVAVDLGRSYSTVNVYDPTTGTAPVMTLDDVATVSLTLSDHPVIIEPH